jgi:hypothetical protein
VVGKIVANPVIVSATAGLIFRHVWYYHADGDRSQPSDLERSGVAHGAAYYRWIAFPAIDEVTPGCCIGNLPAEIADTPCIRGCIVSHGRTGPLSDYLPAVILLLASPTATIAYVMAREMGADSDFAVAAISATTLFSAFTFSFLVEFG